MKPTLLDTLLAERVAKRPVVLATPTSGAGDQRLVHPDDTDPLAADAATALRLDQAREAEIDGSTWFLRPYNPPLRMMLIGAVHIAQPLAAMATQAGYAVTVIDPRTAFAAAARFPGVDLVAEWPDDALTELGIDTRTAIVTLTHDPKLDDPALRVALASPAFYIGSLGSSRTHKARTGRLGRAGFTDAQIARIHGPVGLSIGARSPAEIAISVLAEITRVLRTGEG